MLNIDDRILTEATAEELFLMLHIAKHMNLADNTAFPSVATLCRLTKWSNKTVLKIKKQCIEKKMLSCEQRVLSSGGYTSNIYTIETGYISLFINAKGCKGIEESSTKGTRGGYVESTQGGMEKVHGGYGKSTQGGMEKVHTNKLVTSLSINDINKLVSEQGEIENFATPAPTQKEKNTSKLKADLNKKETPAPLSLENKLSEPTNNDPTPSASEFRLLSTKQEVRDALFTHLSKPENCASLEMDYARRGFQKENLFDYCQEFAVQYFSGADAPKLCSLTDEQLKGRLEKWAYIFNKINKDVLDNAKNAPKTAFKSPVSENIELYTETYLRKILIDSEKGIIQELKTIAPHELDRYLNNWKQKALNDETVMGNFAAFAKNQIKKYQSVTA